MRWPLVLSKARTQLRGFAKDADKMNEALTNLNQAMKNFDGHMDGITKKLESWRAVLEDAGGEINKTSKSIDNLAKSADKSTQASQRGAQTQKQLQAEAVRLRKEVESLTDARNKEAVSADFAATKYKKLAADLQNVSLKMSDAARTRSPADIWAIQAQEAADKIKDIDKEITEDVKAAATRRAEIEKQQTADSKRAQADIVKALQDGIAQQKQARSDNLAAIEAYERRKATAERQADREEEQRNADLARAAKAKAAEDQKELDRQVAQLSKIKALTEERSRVESSVAGGSKNRQQVTDLANAFKRLSGEFELGSEAQRHWSSEAAGVRSLLGIMDSDAKRTTSSFDGVTRSVGRSGSAFNRAGTNVAGFDNNLRGLGVVAIVASLDQLISAAIALGGELVSLAGSAVMAGGALGGALAAGAAQALPVFGLLAGAFQRVKSVFQAFQQSQKEQQAQFTDAEKGSQKAIDKTNALANAQDAQAAAQDNLAQSRKNLTAAQADGIRQLEDLIYQEKAAALAAKGASLNVKEAQKALQDAVAGGASALEVQQRQQALDEARQGAGRARVTATRATQDRQAAGGRVGNLPSVQAATKSVDDAQKALEKANRGLDQAADKTDRAGSSTMTAAANLHFLLSQLSPAERKLYEALNATYDTYRKIFQGTGTKGSGIYGVIIDSFTRAVNEANKLMKMPDVVRTIQGLADSIGKAIDKLIGSFTDEKGIGQLKRIIKDASDNLGPVVDIVAKLGHAFLNIADSANPSFKRLLTFIGDIVDKFLKLTDNREKMHAFFKAGEDNLESWLKLIGAVLHLFAVLTGQSAPEGKKSIDDLTKTIDGWSDKLQANGDKVRDFFAKARKAAYEVAGVLENLAGTLFKSFDPEAVHHFADILNKVVIPALAGVIHAVGRVTNEVAKFVDTPMGAELAKFAVGFFLLSKVAGGIVGTFKEMASITKSLFKPLAGLRDGWQKASKAVKDFQKAQKDASVFAPEASGKFAKLTETFLKLRTAAATTAAFMLGPWGLAIIAVIAIIALLLTHFHEWGKILDGLKAAFKIFTDAIKPAMKDLQDALESIGIHVGDLSDVMKDLGGVGKWLADIIAKVLVEAFKELAHVFAAVVIVLVDGVAGIIKIFKGVIDIVLGFWQALSHGDFDQLLKGFKELGDGIWDIFKGIIRGIEQIFKANWLIDIFLGPFKLAWKAVESFFGISSPSKLAAQLGRDIINGLVNGIRAAAKAVGHVAGWIWDHIKDGFHSLVSAYKNLFSWLIGKWLDLLKIEIQGATKIGEWVWNAIRDSIRAYVHLVSGIVSWLWNKFTSLLKLEIQGFKNLGSWIWGALEDAVKGIGGRLLNIGKSIGGKIVEGFKSAVGAVKSFLGFGGGDDDKKKPAQPKQASAADVNQAAGVIPFGAKDLKTAQKMYADFWHDMQGTVRTSTNYIEKQFADMKDSTAKSADLMYRAIRGSLSDIQNSFKLRGDAMVAGWKSDWFDLAQVAYDALNYIGTQTNKALKALGEKRIDYGLTTPKKPDTDGKAGGGWIGSKGQRGKDGGFYPLGAGEAVLNWQHQAYVEPAMNAFYGHGLGDMFNRVGGYHAGGPGQQGFAAGRFPDFGGHPTNVAPVIRKLIELMQQHFPLLRVTSTRDHSYRTTTGGVSDHTTGHAVDLSATIPYMAKATQWINSSGLWKQLKQGIHNPGLAVNMGQRVSGPGFFAAAWPQHVDHIHLAMLGALHAVLGGYADIKRQIVTPRHTATARLVQSAVDRVRKAAGLKVAGAGAGGDAESYGVHGKGKTANVNLGRRMAAARGWTGREFEALHTLWTGESNWDETAYNKSSGATGIPQSLPGSKMASAGPDWKTNPATQIKWGLGYIASVYGNPINALAKWMSRSPHWYAQGGQIGGPDGSPIPIMAHAGEWILNKGQQLRAAMLSGLSIPGLRGMLGFHGGPDSFAGGGEAATHPARVAIPPVTTIRTLMEDFADTWHGITQIAAVMRKVRTDKTKKGDAKKIGNDYQAIIDLIDNITGDAGIGAVASTIAANLARAQAKLKRATYRVMATGTVKRVVQDGGDLDKQLAALEKQADGLLGEKSDILDSLKKVNAELKKVSGDKSLTKKKREALIQELTAQRTNLLSEQDRINSEIADSVEARYQAQIAQQQKAVDDINARHTNTTRKLDLRKRVASAMGDTDAVGKINQSIADDMAKQVADLQARLPALRKTGDKDLVKTVTDQIADLQTSIKEAAAQSLQDAIDAVGKAATNRGAVLDLFGRMADAMGIVGNAAQAIIPGVGGIGGLGAMSRAQVAQGRIDSATQERAGYITQLGVAQAQGNVGQVADLTSKINELTVQIAENTRTQRQIQIQAEQDAFDYNSSINDLNTQLVQATDAVSGQTSTADLLRLAEEKQTLLVAHQAEIQAELDAAIAAGDQQSTQDLTKALLESKIAVQNNTKAVNDLSGAGSAPVSYTSTAWQWFREAFLTGTGGVMPQYTSPIMADVNSIGPGGGMSSSTTNNGATIVNNFEINEAGQPIDPTKLASTVVFAQSTAQ